MKLLRKSQPLLPVAAVAVTGLLLSPAAVEAQDHAHHGHHMGVPEMDENGRRLDSYDVRHDMTDEQLAALREKRPPRFRGR